MYKTSISQSKPNQTLQQLSLFADEPTPDREERAYALQIGYIPHEQRLTPDKFCKLIHHSSGLTIKGQFSYEQAKEILEITRDWDWGLDKDKIPRGAEKLLSLLSDCEQRRSGGSAHA